MFQLLFLYLCMKEAILNLVLGTYLDDSFSGEYVFFDGVRSFLPLNEDDFKKII